MDYYIDRLKMRGKSIANITAFVENVFDLMKRVPRYFIPYFFSKFIRNVRIYVRNKIYDNLKLDKNLFVSNFHKDLILACYQFIGFYSNSETKQDVLSISAGLPRYAIEPNRVYGRDIFESFKGCLLVPGLLKVEHDPA